MANLTDQLEEIKTLLLSSTKSDKSFAYSSLLHLQEQSINDVSFIQSVGTSSSILLYSIADDIFDNDEEIASQALKCLGFLIYHPSLVLTIPGDGADLIVNSLAKVIITTKMKSICNLGVWCISVQQFNASILAAQFHSLLRAIVHALDNPIGSLSTTFEAIQAVMKLATQLSERMRETSNIWAPPIYRRLVSLDKKERDMSERCLLKIRSIILPPPLTLSKALVHDMKKMLLCKMKELLNQGRKIQTMQAWGWFIRLLGPHALHNRHLINEMLKIPEQTFSDVDPQVQIASQVAWEGLIDALMHPPIRVPKSNTSKANDSGTEKDGFSKSIKLIMMPLVGIISSKCDVSVHSSCLNTWCYLLYKLDTFVNCPLVIRTVWEPIFEAVFRVGSCNKIVWTWNFCIDLLDYFILAKSTETDKGVNNQLSDQLSSNSLIIRPQIYSKFLWKHYPIKSMPWDLSQLDFYVKMIHILLSQGSVGSTPTEIRILACDAALRIFKSVSKGVQNIMKNPATDYNEVMSCLITILGFLKKIYEDVTSRGKDVNDLLGQSLQFVEAVTEELEPSILGSSLYKVALDLKDIDNLRLFEETRNAKELSIGTIAYMDTVSPIVYLTVLYLCGVFKSTPAVAKTEFILRRVHKYIKFLFSSFDPLENLNAIVALLYKFMRFDCLTVWIEIAKGLVDYMEGIKDFSLSKLECESVGSLALYRFLTYPFDVCAGPEKRLMTVETGVAPELSIVSSESRRKLELEHLAEVWKLLYVSVIRASRSECSTSNRIAEYLSLMLNGSLNESTSVHSSNNDDYDPDLFSLYGNVVVCVLEHTSCGGSKEKADGHYMTSSGVDNSLGFTARFMSLAWKVRKTTHQASLAVILRVFSALVQLVGRLYLKEDILSFIQIISNPLLDWFSFSEVHENINHQIQLFWTETINCLQRTFPPIKFDSSFLRLQAPILERTLDHPNSLISELTITFWNLTYGNQIKLDYPQSLVHVLDKLSRTRRLNLCRRSPPLPQKSRSDLYKVTANLNRSLKRVELLENTGNASSGSKRKLAELTEHQKEVRRAQQGRERDCNGRGPGVRTYTSVDFSQGTEESQDSQEIRNPESILEMLRRAG